MFKVVNTYVIFSFYRIDSEDNICISDFGLSKNLADYEKVYFRQDVNDTVKLPLKWMALECMHDSVFSEKSDVVRRGIKSSCSSGRHTVISYIADHRILILTYLGNVQESRQGSIFIAKTQLSRAYLAYRSTHGSFSNTIRPLVVLTKLMFCYHVAFKTKYYLCRVYLHSLSVLWALKLQYALGTCTWYMHYIVQL